MSKVTISDVAEKTGFSRTTISRYLNGKFEFMSEATRETIRDVIAEIGYKPNRMARNLRLKQTNMIGVLVSDITNPFSSILYTGIADECERKGYTLLLANTNDDPEKEKTYIQSMIAQSVDGVILNGTGENIEYIKEVNQSILPIVLADRPIEHTGCDIITSDAKGGVYEMMDLLLEKDYDRVVLVTKKIGKNGTRLARVKAYEAYCQEKGFHDPLVLEYDYDKTEILRDEVTSLYQKLRKEGHKVAFFGLNGVVLRALVHVLYDEGLSFPEDVGLCSFDNWPWMDLVGPGITVIEQETFQIGVASTKQLIDRIQEVASSEEEYINLTCKLIQRGSV